MENEVYAAPEAEIVEESSSRLNKASRGARLGAALLDGAVYLLAMIPLFILGTLSGTQNGEGLNFLSKIMIGVAIVAFLCIAIYNLILIAKYGQTIGKKILNIRIARPTGEKASFGRIFGLRIIVTGLIGAIPVVGSFFPLIDNLFIFGSEKKCLHDYIADTVVLEV
ncbi:MAG: RDD family protein [Planctomycetes bacterium]|nr:RDD family protein [Planctomycetota bacterium]